MNILNSHTKIGTSVQGFLLFTISNHDNFAKAYVNRMWGHFFGRGLNEQAAVDDFGEHNPIVHEELLNQLAEGFGGVGNYDPKNMIRWICNSRPYNLSCTANPSNAGPDAEPFFARTPSA